MRPRDGDSVGTGDGVQVDAGLRTLEREGLVDRQALAVISRCELDRITGSGVVDGVLNRGV